AWLIDLEPGIANEARHCILLYAEGRHIPGVQHIVGRNQKAYLLAGRYHEWIVDLEQIMFAFWRIAIDLVVGRCQHAIELDAVSNAGKIALSLQILVTPFPLVAGDL